MFPDGEPLMTDLYNEEVSLHNQNITFYLNLELKISFRCKIYFKFITNLNYIQKMMGQYNASLKIYMSSSCQ